MVIGPRVHVRNLKVACEVVRISLTPLQEQLRKKSSDEKLPAWEHVADINPTLASWK